MGRDRVTIRGKSKRMGISVSSPEDTKGTNKASMNHSTIFNIHNDNKNSNKERAGIVR